MFEKTPVSSLQDRGSAIELTTPAAPISARRVILATNAFTPLVRSLRRYLVPVYDYVLVSEPLGEEQLAAVGWRSRQGISDCGNQFHYYRLTDDNRILWGGFEAVYRYGGPVAARYDCDDETFGALAQNFFATFPQLRGLRFTHKWGGAIDTCSRFSSFFDRSHAGKVVYVGGYTGLGVGSSRFGAQVALDLVDGRRPRPPSSITCSASRSRFHPSRCAGPSSSSPGERLAAADRNRGRRGLWLRALDRLGLGFDS